MRATAQDVKPCRDINPATTGSIADVRAMRIWRNGRWYAGFARKFGGGHEDDAVNPASSRIPFAIAAFIDVDGANCGVSDAMSLAVRSYGD